MAVDNLEPEDTQSDLADRELRVGDNLEPEDREMKAEDTRSAHKD
jgi:hypothetical protein